MSKSSKNAPPPDSEAYPLYVYNLARKHATGPEQLRHDLATELTMKVLSGEIDVRLVKNRSRWDSIDTLRSALGTRRKSRRFVFIMHRDLHPVDDSSPSAQSDVDDLVESVLRGHFEHESHRQIIRAMCKGAKMKEAAGAVGLSEARASHIMKKFRPLLAEAVGRPDLKDSGARRWRGTYRGNRKTQAQQGRTPVRRVDWCGGGTDNEGVEFPFVDEAGWGTFL